jgi:replicative DNA helicase
MDKFAERHMRWEERLADVQGLAEIIVAKQRHGPVGTITLQFTGEFTRFSNYDRVHGSDR